MSLEHTAAEEADAKWIVENTPDLVKKMLAQRYLDLLAEVRRLKAADRFVMQKAKEKTLDKLKDTPQLFQEIKALMDSYSLCCENEVLIEKIKQLEKEGGMLETFTHYRDLIQSLTRKLDLAVKALEIVTDDVALKKANQKAKQCWTVKGHVMTVFEHFEVGYKAAKIALQKIKEIK